MDARQYLKNTLIGILVFTIPVWIITYIFPTSFLAPLIIVAGCVLIGILGRFIKPGNIRTILSHQMAPPLQKRKYRNGFAIAGGILAMIVAGIQEWLNLPENTYISIIVPLVLIANIIVGVIYYSKKS